MYKSQPNVINMTSFIEKTISLRYKNILYIPIEIYLRQFLPWLFENLDYESLEYTTDHCEIYLRNLTEMKITH
jgi:hypothetical protein